MADLNVVLREIHVGDNLKNLKLGDAAFVPLKMFLQKSALEYHRLDLAKTYVAAAEDNGATKILGYITLLCGEIETDEEMIKDEASYGYKSYPAVKIGRLAVDISARGGNLGRMMVDFALAIVKQDICSRIGCRFMVVDSKQQSVEFYSKVGFTMLDTEENRNRDTPVMFVDLTKINP